MAWTAREICQMATQASETTGRMAQAGGFLNVMLNDLSQTCDLELCRGKFNFNLIADNGSGNGTGPYALPLNYLRHIRDGVFYTIDGVPYQLTPYDLAEFDNFIVTPGFADMPNAFTTDISPLAINPAVAPNLYVWPPSSGTWAVTVRYYKYLPDITTPESSSVVPWFPNQAYLLQHLTGELFKLKGDYATAAAIQSSKEDSGGSGELLRKFLQSQASDDEGKAKTVSLDRRRFGKGYNRLSDTKSIYLTG